MGNRGTWAIGAQGVWGTRGMGNGAQGYCAYGQWGTGGMGYKGYGPHEQWVTWAMGVGVWGIWAMRPTGGMGYRGMGHMGNRGTGGMGYKGYGPCGQWGTGVWATWAMGPMGDLLPKYQKDVKLSKKNVKLSKRCQMSKIQTPRLWRRFTKKLNWHNEVHTYWRQFWRHKWWSLKTLKMFIETIFGQFWWPSHLTSKLTSICVNLIMSIYFCVNLLHSPDIWLFDIWHLFDNLTFWHIT